MSRRVLAVIVSLVVAVVGGLLVVNYVLRADERAMADMEPTKVLVVEEPIQAGTPVEAVVGLVTVRTIPATAAVPGALATLDELAGTVTTADLQPGEQLLAARFAAPEDLEADEEQAAAEVPAGLHEVSVQLEPRRVVGGRLKAGETVAVFVSLNTEEAQLTHLTLHKVLVTRVDGGVGIAENDEGVKVEQGPAESIMVTLALSAPDAERVVYAAEFGAIWLSREPADAPQDGTRIVDLGNIYQ